MVSISGCEVTRQPSVVCIVRICTLLVFYVGVTVKGRNGRLSRYSAFDMWRFNIKTSFQIAKDINYGLEIVRRWRSLQLG